MNHAISTRATWLKWNELSISSPWMNTANIYAIHKFALCHEYQSTAAIIMLSWNPFISRIGQMSLGKVRFYALVIVLTLTIQYGHYTFPMPFHPWKAFETSEWWEHQPHLTIVHSFPINFRVQLEIF